MMKLKPYMTEEDWEFIESIKTSPALGRLKKYRDVVRYNTSMEALMVSHRTITNRNESGESEVEMTVAEQLAMLRGKVLGMTLMITAIEQADRQVEAIKKRKETLKKQEEVKREKNAIQK